MPRPFGLGRRASHDGVALPSRLLKNPRRSRCPRRGPRCKAARRRRCGPPSSRSDNAADGAAPRQPFGRKGLRAICFVPARRKGIHPSFLPRRASHLTRKPLARGLRSFSTPCLKGATQEPYTKLRSFDNESPFRAKRGKAAFRADWARCKEGERGEAESYLMYFERLAPRSLTQQMVRDSRRER